MNEIVSPTSADLVALQSAVDRLAHLPDEFRTLRPSPEKVQAVRAAAARLQAAVARERGADQPVLTIAFAGCTGAGKSTLINALARAKITRVIGRAATTRQAHVYHHQDLRMAGLPQELAQNAVFVSHDRPELYHKVLIDTPDLDTAVVTNRQTTKAILKAATLVLYVFTPDRYAEERVWSVIEQERRFSAFAAVLNKADWVSPDELAEMTDDLRGLFATRGAADVRIFRTVATRHQAGEEVAELRSGGVATSGDDASAPFPSSSTPPPSHTATPPQSFGDDFTRLRTFIEQELRKSDILRLARRQRRAATVALRGAVDAVAPDDVDRKLDEAAATGSEAVGDAAARLALLWQPVFAAAEDGVLPAAKRRFHERFRGPMRAWFAMWDGAAALAAKFAGKPVDALEGHAIRAALESGRPVVEDRLAAIVQRVQDRLHAGGLPVGRWTAVTAGRSPAEQVIGDVSISVEAACRQHTTSFTAAQQHLARVVSWISVAIVAVVLGGGAVRFAIDLTSGRYEGGALLLNVVGLTAVSMVVLHLVVSLGGPGGQPGSSGTAVAADRAVRDVLGRLLGGWLNAYRTDLEADVADLRAPLVQIERAFGAEDAALGEAAAGSAEGTGLGDVPTETQMATVAPKPSVAVVESAGVVSVEKDSQTPIRPEPASLSAMAENPPVVESYGEDATNSKEPTSHSPNEPATPALRKSLSDYLKELKT